MKYNKVFILHDTNGRPYYAAVEKLFNNVIYIESSVFRLSIRSIYKKYNVKNTLLRAINNLKFRFALPFYKKNLFIMGMAPYDFRIIYYGLLALRNRVVLHTSWPYWGERGPRHYFFLDKVFKKIWKFYITRLGIEVVCVSEKSYMTTKVFINRNNGIYKIPHTVNLCKVLDAKCHNKKIKNSVVFVGKLIPEKGIKKVINLASRFSDLKVCIIGDGIMKEYVIDAEKKYRNISYLGYISDRQLLSNILDRYQFLYLPSQKNKNWEELFGVSIIEAMSRGCIPICSNHVGPQEIIEDKVNGFLVKDNHDEKTIYDIISNLNISDNVKLSDSAIQRSCEYSLNNVSKKWRKVINFGKN